LRPYTVTTQRLPLGVWYAEGVSNNPVQYTFSGFGASKHAAIEDLKAAVERGRAAYGFAASMLPSPYEGPTTETIEI
jgi:hypothetical protein